MLINFAFFSVVEIILHVTATFVNTPFSKEYHILIKNLSLVKGYTSQKLRKELLSENWKERSLWRLLFKITSREFS